MKKLFAVALMSLAASAWGADAPPKYQTSCFACHMSGAAGAPKTGDRKDCPGDRYGSRRIFGKY